MTEEEAKSKWCPFAQKDDDGDVRSYLRGLRARPEVPRAFCIGSACMAWREGIVESVDSERRPTYITGGYCGLAGKP